jgi:hypothetical protein
MRRTLTTLAAATTLALGAAVAAAGPAAAAPSETAIGAAGERSVLFYCHGSPGQAHPGQHKGWDKQDQPSTERRNVGGNCPV